LALVLAACGDDDDETTTNTTEEAAGDTTDAYCALAEELDGQDEFFTVEQLEELRAAAPEEIRDEAELVVPIFIEAIEAGDPFAAFEDPVVDANIEVIETFENEVCGLDSGGDDGDGSADPDFEIAAEDEELCAVAIEIDSQEDFPSAEQLEAYRSVAPAEIADAVDVVVDAFVAAGDDPFAAFEAPGVEEAFSETIEPYEAEHCGLHGDGEGEDDEEQDPSLTEPDDSAAQVAVTATDYAFAIDPAPAAGRTQFTMTNEGEERHVMYVFKLAEGSTLEDVLESEGETGFEVDGESDTATAGETAILTLDLTPGDWAMICYIPTADGTPHFAEGMQSEFTVQ
jgi:hypothetical protein